MKSLKNKQAFWKDIASEFSPITVTGTKCEDKWKNLKNSYRDYVQRSKWTGSAPSKFEFADEMGQVMGDDPSVVPKMTLDSVGNIASAAWKEDDDEEALDGDLEEVGKSVPSAKPNNGKELV